MLYWGTICINYLRIWSLVRRRAVTNEIQWYQGLKQQCVTLRSRYSMTQCNPLLLTTLQSRMHIRRQTYTLHVYFALMGEFNPSCYIGSAVCQYWTKMPSMAYFTDEVNPELTKPPLKFHDASPKLGLTSLTHLPLVPYICVSESGQHWFRRWLLAYSAPSHYLNQCWVIVNWVFRIYLQWSFNKNSYIFIQENAFENLVWKMAAILSRPQRVNKIS